MKQRRPGNVVALPHRREGRQTVQELALEELEGVYAFLLRRVGNRQDAEDLTQQVALRAVPRLDAGAGRESVRAYLFATARTELAEHWAARFGLPQEPLDEERLPTVGPAGGEGVEEEDAAAMERARRILGRLPGNYAKVLELRFLRNLSAREVAAELGTTAGNVRIMQLRALRAAAQVQIDE